MEKFKNIDYSFYIITSENIEEDNLIEIIKKCFPDYGTVLQLRIKSEIDEGMFIKKAINLKKIIDKYNIPLIINDNINVAKYSNSSGVHIGKNDTDIKTARKYLGYEKIIGLSVSTVKEAIEAEKNGANYLGVGAIFNTKTKIDADYISIETLKEIKENVNIPVVAIGGITEYNISKLYGFNLDGVAFISEIMNSKNLELKLEKLKKKINLLK